MELDFEQNFPVRVSSGALDYHPTGVETLRGLLAAVWTRGSRLYRSYSLDRGLTWASEQVFLDQPQNYTPRARYNNRGGFALAWANPADLEDIMFEEINEIMNISQHLMNIRIQRSDDATAKGASFSIANPKRLYDPEREGTAWTGVIQPGAGVEIHLGYGGELVKRFKGFIDDVSSDDRAANIEVTCRGDMKQLLDGNLKTKRKFDGPKRVQIMADMAVEAGMDPDLIIIQDDAATFTGEYEREKTFGEVVAEHSEALGFSLTEPDGGGLRSIAPVLTASPVWFYEEEINMYTRTREWDDDEVYTSVLAYRDPVYKKDGTTLKIAGVEAEIGVDTPFLTPAKKTHFIKLGRNADYNEAVRVASSVAARISRRGRTIQIATPLNVALELGDVINVRRKSWSQSGLYIVEALDDDCQRSTGQSRSQGGQFASGQGGGTGFVNTIQARRLDLGA